MSQTCEDWEKLVAAADGNCEKGQFAQGRALLEQALVQAESFDKKDPRLVTTLHKLADAHLGEGQDGEAEKCLKQAVEICTSQFGPHARKTADASNTLAGFLYEKGRFVEAESLCRKILNTYEKTIGQKSREVAKVSQNLAMILQEQNNLPEAEKFYQKAINVMRDLALPLDSDLISLMENYSNLLRTLGRAEEADHLQACAMGRVSGLLSSVTNRPLPSVAPRDEK